MRIRSLTSRLLTSGMLAIVLPMVFLSVFSLTTASSALTEQARKNVLAAAVSLSKTINLWFDNQRNQIKALSSIVYFKNITPPQQNQVITELQLRKQLSYVITGMGDRFEAILLVKTNGFVYAGRFYNGDSIVRPKWNLGQREYFKKVLKKKKAVISDVIISKMTEQPVVAFAAPVKSETGKLLYIMTVTLRMNYIIDMINENRIGRQGYAFMLNSSGYTVAHRKRSNTLKKNLLQTSGTKQLARSMIAGKTGFVRFDEASRSWTAGFAPVGLNSWSIGAVLPEAEFLAASTRIRNGQLIISAVFLLLGMVILTTIVRRIAKPLRRIAGFFAEAVTEVNSASSQILISSKALADSASDQAASLEESSASLEQLSGMTGESAENTAEANKLMQQSASLMETTANSMEQLLETMASVHQASLETGKIIKSIDEIAFQTNLLSLNAAVEAARAGEAGAGFSVVAAEVRSLAQRSAEAARSTNELLHQANSETEKSVSLVNDTSTTFMEVKQSIIRVRELIERLSAAGQEQFQGIDNINRAVSHLDRKVQDSAANAQETAASIHETDNQISIMEQQLELLKQLIFGSAHADEKLQQTLQESKKRRRKRRKQSKETENPKPAAFEESTVSTPEESTGAVPQEDTEAVPEENAEAVPQESTEAVPQENTEAAPQENTEAAPQEGTGAAPQESAEAAPQENAEAVPQENTITEQKTDSSAEHPVRKENNPQ